MGLDSLCFGIHTTVGGGSLICIVQDKDFVFYDSKFYTYYRDTQIFISHYILISLLVFIKNKIVMKKNRISRFSSDFIPSVRNELNKYNTEIQKFIHQKTIKGSINLKLIKPYIKSCASFDQTKGMILMFDHFLNNNNTFSTIFSARGRGKSSLLGMLTTVMILLGINQIEIFSIYLSNINIILQFIITSLSSVGFKEKIDFKIVCYNLNRFKKLKLIFTSLVLKYINIEYKLKHNFHRIGDCIIIDEENANKIFASKFVSKAKHIILSISLSGFYSYGFYLPASIVTFYSNEVFWLRLKKFLHIILITPIRFRKEDGLEKWAEIFLYTKPNLQYYLKIKEYNPCITPKLHVLGTCEWELLVMKKNKLIHNILSYFYLKSSINTSLTPLQKLISNNSFFIICLDNEKRYKSLKGDLWGIIEMSLIKPEKVSLLKNLFHNTLNLNNILMMNSLFRCITFKTIIFEPFFTTLRKEYQTISSVITLLSKIFQKRNQIRNVQHYLTIKISSFINEFNFWFKIGFSTISISFNSTNIVSLYLIKNLIARVDEFYFTDSVLSETALLNVQTILFYQGYRLMNFSPLFILMLCKFYHFVKCNKSNQTSVEIDLIPAVNFLDLVKLEIFLLEKKLSVFIFDVFKKFSTIFINNLYYFETTLLEKVVLILLLVKNNYIKELMKYLKINAHQVI
mmetsp:Transcript_25598/g.41051  ORF Transcript_25598/g.41051 Transcript_25598/m.41051 type:complete len:684 (-) Transcript_25598:7399-9450(-)